MATSDSIKDAAQKLYDALAEARELLAFYRPNDCAMDGILRTIDAALAKARGEDRSHEGK